MKVDTRVVVVKVDKYAKELGAKKGDVGTVVLADDTVVVVEVDRLRKFVNFEVDQVAEKFEMGDQILRVPEHVFADPHQMTAKDLENPEIQAGFVVADLGTDCFCRYWTFPGSGVLRTKANAERTEKSRLVRWDSETNGTIRTMLIGLRYV